MEDAPATETPYDGEELLTLHGRAVLDYATLCAGSSPGAAERLAEQAFWNTRGDAAGVDFPWRPRLLAAVLETAREWRTDDRRAALHPSLREGGRPAPAGAGRGGRPASAGVVGEGGRPAGSAADPGTRDRRLLLRAFRSLPHRAQVLLWHTEVEAEDIEAVASLLGAEPSLLNPGRARTLLRDECVRAHLDLAPDERCRRLNRLIDVHARPGSGETMAEVLDHLDHCAHCAAAVDQLDHSGGRLPALLAEAVLVFRAADYLATRTARRATAPAHAPAEPTDTGPRPTAAPDSAPRRRHRWPLLAAMAVVLCGLIAATPMALDGTSETGGTGETGEISGTNETGRTGIEEKRGGASGPTPEAPARGPSVSPTPVADEALVTRLRNMRTGLCLDVTASARMAGARAVTADCGGSTTQVWRLEDGGRLRSQAAPDLCLNAEPQGTLALRSCATTAGGESSGDTRYDLAADGLLTLVEEPGVALTPERRATGSAILLEPVPEDRIRRSQRWRTDETPTRAPSPPQTARRPRTS
ncbi:RICIN domain-containing protein [Streptomyces sp. A012304]|uniref:RICIN domain-containing protein n=1 Tax=Streptomyces sp. A012304 TaxID=375446 RepID=UPI00223009B7|nr:RICIN domain-containing protein [Streptomyces sp. A012304]GKQ34052.1 hydrolase [Streptomyces sp. A012304]